MSREKQIDETCEDCTHYCVCPFHLTGQENKRCVHWCKQVEGEWIDQYHGKYANQLYKCSVCGETAFQDGERWFLTQYCPNCGKPMKGANNEQRAD